MRVTCKSFNWIILLISRRGSDEREADMSDFYCLTCSDVFVKLDQAVLIYEFIVCFFVFVFFRRSDYEVLTYLS